MAKILKIEIEGFVSVIEKIKYKFDRPGLNIITGKNGAGKTLIFNALAYVLYGQTLKLKSSTLPWPWIMGDNYQGCKVGVRLESGIQIYRCNEYRGKLPDKKLGGNRLYVEVDGRILQNLRNKSDVQCWINQTVGYTWPLFKSAVLFPQELASILEEDGPTKKRVFDEAFASQFINHARLKVETTLVTLNQEYERISAELSTTDSLLTNNRDLLEQMEQENKDFAQRKGRLIHQLRREVKALQKKKAVFVKKYHVDTERPKVKQTIKTLNDQRFKIASFVNPNLNREIQQVDKELERYGVELNELELEIRDLGKDTMKCNSCQQPLKGDALTQYREKIKTKVASLKRKGKGLELDIKDATRIRELALIKLKDQSNTEKALNGIDALILIETNSLDKLNLIGKRTKKLAMKIRLKKMEISTIRKNHKAHDTEKIISGIKNFEETKTSLEKTLQHLQTKLDVQRWLLKDPLSNSGLKAFIFDSMLRRVNHYLGFYKTFIGFSIHLGMNLESHNKDFEMCITKGSQEIPYEDLSKGQKQLAKVAVCFAVNKSLQATKPINILLLDELFESLDPENVEIVGNIVKEEAKTKSVHIITHHQSFNPSNCYKTFVKLNDKDQTVIEQKYKEA